MIKLYNINTFAEAMLYYLGRANDEQCSSRLDETLRQHPEYAKDLHKVQDTIDSVEEKLDTGLEVDEKLLMKYFKNFDDVRTQTPPFGFCLASVMTFCPLLEHCEYTADEMQKYLKECPFKQRMYNFCFGLLDNCETLYPDESGVKEFSQRLDNLQLPLEEKWAILNAAFNYDVHIDELLSLIMPAAKLIQESESRYKPLVDEFFSLYSDKKAQENLEQYFEIKFKPNDVIKVVPMFSLFDYIYTMTRTNENNGSGKDSSCPKASLIGSMYFGIGRNVIKQPLRDEASVLCDKLKALSDNTRLDILFYLCSHRAYGQEICTLFGLQRSSLSYHISKLLTAGFVTAELSGSQTYYTADKAGIKRMVDSFLNKIQ